MKEHLALKPGKPLSHEIRRVANDLIDDGLERIGSVEAEPGTRIHSIRKRLKELRAVVRLVRDEIGTHGYRVENTRLRDAGRLLSPVRDTSVLIDSLFRLCDLPEARDIAGELDGLRRKLEREYRERTVRLISGDALRNVGECLNAMQRRVAAWPIRHEHFTAIGSGLERVYRNGLESMLRARDNPDDVNLHEWRKQAKYLWYHSRMIALAWPPVLNGLAESLHDLTDRLGDDHDLAVLARTCGNPLLQDRAPFARTLISIVEERRNAIRVDAWPIGTRVFAERPDAFVERLRTYWRAGSYTGFQETTRTEEPS